MDLLVASINAVVVTVVAGIVAWLLKGRFDALDRRIEALDTRLTGQIHSVETQLDGRIGSLEARLDGRIDSLEARLDGRFDTLQSRRTPCVRTSRKWRSAWGCARALGTTE
jgi:hypothetical protein